MMYSLLLLSLVACYGAPSAVVTTTETVRFNNGDVTLEGDLVLPGGSGKVPLIVFVHGSGRSTRQESNKISDELNSAGYATFRYDKRGVGKSGGTFSELSAWNSVDRVPLLASDAAAAIRTLRDHPRVNEKIVVMGGSQAGWIIPVVLDMVDVSGAVIISGPTVSVGEEIYYSELAENKSHTQEDADAMLSKFDGQHGFTNVDYIVKMTKPSLWIFGGKDISIPAKKCIATLEAIRSRAKLPIEIKIYPDANHGIYNETTKQMEGYVAVVVNWLKKQ